jgi:serine/threonine-protein kinase
MRKYIAIVATAGAIAAIAAPAYGGYPIPKACKVPNVVHKTLASAESFIVVGGCSVGKVTAQTSSTVPKGEVISQSPAGGTTGPLGKPVNLVVSLGTPPPGAKCIVPNVVGKNQAIAQQLIVNANCATGNVTLKVSTTVKKGNVISQKPPGGTTGAVGTKVALTVSSGPKCVVPNVIGKTLSAAETALFKANCTLGTVTNKKSSTVPKGNVISVSPKVGTTTSAKVNLTVSTGKK